MPQMYQRDLHSPGEAQLTAIVKVGIIEFETVVKFDELVEDRQGGIDSLDTYSVTRDDGDFMSAYGHLVEPNRGGCRKDENRAAAETVKNTSR